MGKNRCKLSVLYVVSGNKEKISPIILNQGNSIKNYGVNIEYYQIKGKGLFDFDGVCRADVFACSAADADFCVYFVFFIRLHGYRIHRAVL